MGKIVGIDLGTTNSAVAIVEAGMPGLLADSEGRRLLPSVVHYPIEGEPVTGHAAQRILAVEPKRTIYSIKRFIGSRLQDLSESDLKMEYQIVIVVIFNLFPSKILKLVILLQKNLVIQ